ncbi:MAG: hypothetical protein ACXAB7_00335 [Candidatus Kariarchaeaceae archaeon]|jgi:hypothetical protein
MDTKYQNMAKEYKCQSCDTQVSAPMHCGHPMHLEDLEGKTTWVCWMGITCGMQEFNACCSNPNLNAM